VEAKGADFGPYPQDWKDYDSKAAFSRDFLEEKDSWIPPVKDFIPSKAKQLAESKPSTNKKASNTSSDGFDDFDKTVDWLQARRSRLEGDQKMPSQMLTPQEAESFRHENSQISVIPYTLLTPAEISNSLSAQGATDIHVIETSEYDALYGFGLGCDYLMVVTGRNSSHIRVLAESLVRNLKSRRLHERGVVGAREGPEGGRNLFSNKPSRNRASRSGQNLSSKMDDEWMVVDCGNIHVHILESVTRACLNIESLWDLSNPNSEGRKLRRINWENDDEVDTYVAENPVPEEYARKLLLGGNNYITSDSGRVHKITTESFKRKSYSGKWSGSKPKRRRR
jgi:ribosomal silencing factor RsfS